MNFEKYTDRARGFVQSAQSLALREGHQQFAPEHLLKVLLDDPEGLAAGLIDRSGGNSRAGACRPSRPRSPSCRRCRAAAPARSISTPALARVFDAAEKAAEKAGDSFVTVERLLLALALEKDSEAGKILAKRRRHAAEPQRRDRRAAQGPHRRLAPRPRTPMTR